MGCAHRGRHTLKALRRGGMLSWAKYLRMTKGSTFHNNICQEYRQSHLLPIFRVRCFLCDKDYILWCCAVSWLGHYRDEDSLKENLCIQHKLSYRCLQYSCKLCIPWEDGHTYHLQPCILYIALLLAIDLRRSLLLPPLLGRTVPNKESIRNTAIHKVQSCNQNQFLHLSSCLLLASPFPLFSGKSPCS